MVEGIMWSSPQVVIGHQTCGISKDLSVPIGREVQDRSQRRRRHRRKSQSIDMYGSCSPPGTILDNKWRPPQREGLVKCNVNAYWVGPETLSGSAWIARDCNGSVLFHARETLTPSPNRIFAELRCIWGAVQSLQVLGFREVIISSDCQAAIAALRNPSQWPLYRCLLDVIFRISQSFSDLKFEIVSSRSNSVARDIAGSVIKDGRFKSYLARGGPRWLLNRIHRDAQDLNPISASASLALQATSSHGPNDRHPDSTQPVTTRTGSSSSWRYRSSEFPSLIKSPSSAPLDQDISTSPKDRSLSPSSSPLTTNPPSLLSSSPPNHHVRFESPGTAPRCSASAKRSSVSRISPTHFGFIFKYPPVQSKSMTIDRTINHTGSHLIKSNEEKTPIDSEGFIKPLKTARHTKKDVRQQNSTISLKNDFDILSSEE